MRNLVLAHRQRLQVSSLEAPDLPLERTLLDPVGDSVFCLFGPSSDIDAIEIQQISVCLAL